MTNPASVGSVGDGEVKKFPDFPPPNLLITAFPLLIMFQAQDQKMTLKLDQIWEF